jgi:hypothetical protein
MVAHCPVRAVAYAFISAFISRTTWCVVQEVPCAHDPWFKTPVCARLPVCARDTTPCPTPQGVPRFRPW